MLHTGQACLYGVVFGLRDWIKLVVMAARTTNGEAVKRAAGRADHIVEFIGPLRRGQHRVRTFYLVPCPADKKCRRGVLAKRVPCELLNNEPIIRLVRIERSNDVVAKLPGVRAGIIHLETVSFSKSHHIQPMAGPAFPITRRSQQVIDDFFVGIR